MFYYKAIITEVYDGDTVTVDIDLGFNNWKKGEKLRLYGIDTPELRGSELIKGREARDFVRERVLGKEIIIHTYKDKKGKYGRYLATIMYRRHPEDTDNINLNDELVAKGMAVPYFGGTK